VGAAEMARLVQNKEACIDAVSRNRKVVVFILLVLVLSNDLNLRWKLFMFADAGHLMG
jgi:hypothetical protein